MPSQKLSAYPAVDDLVLSDLLHLIRGGTNRNITAEDFGVAIADFIPDVGVSAHGDLTGLAGDDHPQYPLVSGARAFTGVIAGVTPTSPAHLATKQYVDDNAGGISTVVDVASFATGLGTEASPWVEWEAAIDTVYRTYYFREGWFSTASLVKNLEGIHLVGETGTVIKHTGTGVAIQLGTTTAATWTKDYSVKRLKINGNINTTDGLLLCGIRHGLFEQIKIINVHTGFRQQACVSNVFNDIATLGWPEYSGILRPTYGIVMETRPSDGAQATASVVNDGVFEALAAGGAGIYLKNTWFNQFNGGTSEGNIGKGVQIDVGSVYNTFINHDCEANQDKDFDVVAPNNVFINCLGTSGAVANSCHFNNIRTTVIGGKMSRCTIVAGCDGLFADVDFGGTFTNNSTTATLIRCFESTTGLYPIGYREQAVPSLVSAGPAISTYTPDVNRYSLIQLFVNQNLAIQNPTVTPKNGQEVTFRIIQFVTPGDGVVSWGTAYRGSGGVIPANTLAGNKSDYYTFRYSSNYLKWDLVSSLLNL